MCVIRRLVTPWLGQEGSTLIASLSTSIIPWHLDSPLSFHESVWCCNWLLLNLKRLIRDQWAGGFSSWFIIASLNLIIQESRAFCWVLFKKFRKKKLRQPQATRTKSRASSRANHTHTATHHTAEDQADVSTVPALCPSYSGIIIQDFHKKKWR